MLTLPEKQEGSQRLGEMPGFPAGPTGQGRTIMNCLIRKNTGMRRRITALPAAIVLGISLVGGSTLAVDFTQQSR